MKVKTSIKSGILAANHSSVMVGKVGRVGPLGR